MKISLDLQENVHFKVSNGENSFSIDGPEKFGGQNLGFRPMQLVLASLASCASMDIVHILKQGKQDLQGLSIEVSGERKDEVPSVFDTILLTFNVKGNINENKLKRAIDLAVNKYCSVASMLKDVVIKTEYNLED